MIAQKCGTPLKTMRLGHCWESA